jgi:EAL domain-containing protein (putative c-di-GMP-specific phosphodiesterase class I)
LITLDDFIPLSEDTGVIDQIGVWVLNAVCTDAARWPANVRLAVNPSPVQFRKMNLSDAVMNALAAARIFRSGSRSRSPKRH